MLVPIGSEDVGYKAQSPKIRQPHTLGLVREESIHFASGTVVGNNSEALVIHVQDKILTLDLMAENEADDRHDVKKDIP
jgi:hypothetical protein